MDFTLHIWRQRSSKEQGKLETHRVSDISADMSVLEMLNKLNRELTQKGIEPFAFEYDCMEGICGTCCLMVNGIAHGGRGTTCQLYMRNFKDGDHITIEPFRARPFPVIKDLVVDRSSFERIQHAGGYISVNTGGAPDANAILISGEKVEESMDAAQCIQCGACVAACKNGSAMLFVSAKIAHLGRLPQGRVEHSKRVSAMVSAMDEQGFGSCTNQYECEAVCPKGISVQFIAEMNRDYLKNALLRVVR